MRDRGLQLAIDFERAMDARELGIQRSGDHADAVESGWRYQALALLVAFAKQQPGPFLIEQARAYAEANGLPPPPDARAWGSVVRLAASKRRIEKTGGAAAAASSNCSLNPLWRYCVAAAPSGKGPACH